LRVALPTTRRPPTLIERIVGRRRARRLRRRVGLVAVGLGASMLRPRPAPLALGLALLGAATLVACGYALAVVV
jgi:hypothetical protein